MTALVLIAYPIGLLLGEALRDEWFGSPEDEPGEPGTGQPRASSPKVRKRCRWQLYSGLFILLKRKGTLSAKTWRRPLHQVLDAFASSSGHLSELMSEAQNLTNEDFTLYYL